MLSAFCGFPGRISLYIFFGRFCGDVVVIFIGKVKLVF